MWELWDFWEDGNLLIEGQSFWVSEIIVLDFYDKASLISDLIIILIIIILIIVSLYIFNSIIYFIFFINYFNNNTEYFYFKKYLFFLFLWTKQKNGKQS